jgi:hypothetical protein
MVTCVLQKVVLQEKDVHLRLLSVMILILAQKIHATLLLDASLNTNAMIMMKVLLIIAILKMVV